MHAGSTIPNRGEDNLRSESARPNAAEAEAMASSIRIAETFTSLQGEGKLTGTRSFFIRTSGCNLRCWFCDTPYASWEPEGGFRRVSELVAEAIDSHCSHVVLTGGEPLLPVLSVELVERLRSAGLHVTIETAGTIDRPCIADLMSISPKLQGSGPEHTDVNGRKKPERSEMPSTTRARWASRHEQTRWRPEVIAKLISRATDYQIKFVVDTPADFTHCAAAVEELLIPAEHIWIMPQGTDDQTLDSQREWLAPLVDLAGYHYCDRMHVRWYGNRRGT